MPFMKAVVCDVFPGCCVTRECKGPRAQGIGSTRTIATPLENDNGLSWALEKQIAKDMVFGDGDDYARHGSAPLIP